MISMALRPTLATPCLRVRLKPPVPLRQPKISSIRFRMRWLVRYPGLRVVRKRHAERRCSRWT